MNRKIDLAKVNKKDEFYTDLRAVENEVGNYADQFRGKKVYGPCDDPIDTSFAEYFILKFDELCLKKLTTTHFTKPPEKGHKFELTQELFNEINTTFDRSKYDSIVVAIREELKKDAPPYPYNQLITKLEGIGDFRDSECISILKDSDIVVTNPPFSLFREFISLLIENNMKFLIMGNMNAITYKETFKLIKEGKLWVGYNFNKTYEFRIPADYEKWSRVDEKEGYKYGIVPGICWFTNLETEKSKQFIKFGKKYDPTNYPKYNNYDAINVDKVIDIPYDYDGAMGVPITFLDKYNPEQFEIVGLGISNSGLEIGVKPYKPEHKIYRKDVQKRGAVDGDLYMITNGVVDVPYARIIIKPKR